MAWRARRHDPAAPEEARAGGVAKSRLAISVKTTSYSPPGRRSSRPASFLEDLLPME
jgi:hypothetical protein